MCTLGAAPANKALGPLTLIMLLMIARKPSLAFIPLPSCIWVLITSVGCVRTVAAIAAQVPAVKFSKEDVCPSCRSHLLRPEFLKS